MRKAIRSEERSILKDTYFIPTEIQILKLLQTEQCGPIYASN